MLKVHHYKIKKDGDWGSWAEIMIREDGFFAAISGYGNYSYHWGNAGTKDIREFFLRCERDWDYFAKKLNPNMVIDDEKSFENIKELIKADTLYDKFNCSKEKALRYVNEFVSFKDFLYDYDIKDYFEYVPYEYCVMTFDSNVVDFVKKILPELSQMIKLELENENQLTSEKDETKV